MNAASATTAPLPESAIGLESPATTIWSATIEAEAEPAILARVLQRLMVQSAQMERLTYAADPESDDVRIEILFRATTEHAQLLAKRWEMIVTVQRVSLCVALVRRLHSM